MVFLALIIFLSVNLFFFVFLKFQRGKRVFLEVHLTKIGMMFFLYQLLCLVIFYKFKFILFYILVIHLPFLIIYVWPRFIRGVYERAFVKEFPSFLTHVCVTMRSGKALRTALRESVFVFNHFGQKRISEIIDCVVFSQQKKLAYHSGFSREVLQKLSEIDKESINSVQKLENWRVFLNKKKYFRRKSGQILLQVRVQAVLISFLYLALLAFVLSNYKVIQVREVVLFSFLLNVIGVFLCFKLGKKIKWKF